jgi:hypothetical protein
MFRRSSLIPHSFGEPDNNINAQRCNPLIELLDGDQNDYKFQNCQNTNQSTAKADHDKNHDHINQSNEQALINTYLAPTS